MGRGITLHSQSESAPHHPEMQWPSPAKQGEALLPARACLPPSPAPAAHCLPACLPLPAADLFDILLPMLNIYQEFVRNHQYSLQILAHCKQNRDFDKLLKHYEAKPDCEERTLETFLTYPMFQVRLWGTRSAWART